MQALHVHTFKFLGEAARRFGVAPLLQPDAVPRQWKTTSLGKCLTTTVSQRAPHVSRWRGQRLRWAARDATQQITADPAGTGRRSWASICCPTGSLERHSETRRQTRGRRIVGKSDSQSVRGTDGQTVGRQAGRWRVGRQVDRQTAPVKAMSSRTEGGQKPRNS